MEQSRHIISITGVWYGVDLNMDKNDFPFDSANLNKMIFIPSMYTSCFTVWACEIDIYIMYEKYKFHMWVILL